MAKNYKVVSQNILDRKPNGARFTHGMVRKSNLVIWGDFATKGVNLKLAILHMYNQLIKEHIGGVIYLQVYKNGKPTNEFAKVYQGKLGHDDKFFVRYEDNIRSWVKQQKGLPKEINN